MKFNTVLLKFTSEKTLTCETYFTHLQYYDYIRLLSSLDAKFVLFSLLLYVEFCGEFQILWHISHFLLYTLRVFLWCSKFSMFYTYAKLAGLFV